MNINFFRMLLMTFLAVAGLAACSDDDEPKDSVKEIRMLVSAETGVTYAWGDDMKKNPIECLLVKTEGDSEEWQDLGFKQIKGFTYERGHEYYLSVKRTILANPPADASDRRYELIRVLQDRLVADPEIPIDKEIKTEADIEYYDLCPFEKYGVASTIVVDDEGKIDGKVEYDNVSPLPSYDKARIWLVNILDHKDPNWVKFHSVPYQATYSYVISPFTDKIRLVRNESSGPMFKNAPITFCCSAVSLITSSVFYNGQVYDAYTFVSDLIKSAKKRIILIDNYVDETVLTLLDKRGNSVSAIIYTQQISRQFQLDIDRHNAQYAPIDVETFRLSHDRFLCIDDDVYHIGASIKDLGKKWFGFSKMEILTPDELVERINRG